MLLRVPICVDGRGLETEKQEEGYSHHGRSTSYTMWWICEPHELLLTDTIKESLPWKDRRNSSPSDHTVFQELIEDIESRDMFF